ncbi:hypothetical protein FITA111629_04840 [Filibacter tadaridae]|uniref:YceG-like family protein n=1 Tax=Filibacter tadaridae TaxID=2483811 RepID=A0A3P5XCK0_9BACL|nr:hypothetical protein [Filibacter tadaridae]VDC32436.1 YceG-like family protein [Filibacter tadaridae]
MIREVLRTIGVACIVAGGLLYFISSGDIGGQSDGKRLQVKLDQLQKELDQTKEMLAIAQTVSSSEKKPVEQKKKKKEEKAISKTEPTKPIVKTILTIDPGSNSAVVSALLERTGVIDDAAAFDAYLADNKLTGKIQIGDHEVDSSMDFQTIAKQVTSVN